MAIHHHNLQLYSKSEMPRRPRTRLTRLGVRNRPRVRRSSRPPFGVFLKFSRLVVNRSSTLNSGVFDVSQHGANAVE